MRELAAGLRGLPEPPVPPAIWTGVVRRLAEGQVAMRRPRFAVRAPLQAAAAVVLLLGGFTAGRLTAPERSLPSLAQAERPGTLDAALRQVERTGDAYRQAVSHLQSFEGRGAPQQDARLVAERLAALDVLVGASRAALEVVPEDPVVNGYLYAAMQERQRLVASLASARAEPASVYRW